MRSYVPVVSFAALLGLLCILTVVGVGVAVVTHHPLLIPVVLGVAIAIGIAYIVIFRGNLTSEPEEEAPVTATRGGDQMPVTPGDGTSPPAGVSAEGPIGAPVAPEDLADNEPFYDPVEEADRLDSSKASGDAPPSGGDDPK
jgi:hypothetical protein